MKGQNDVKSLGRVRYVEPTNFFLEKAGTFSDGINFPYEDYNIAVDFSIIQTNRYCCGWWTLTGNDRNKITYSSKNGTISFLGGTKIGGDNENGYLTTNFTDISMTNPESNTNECLGIESIDIAYNSWFYPQVTIKFVDIRGATIMLPAENGYYNNTRIGDSSAIYKAFFSFPYPTFLLKVKGFYGKGVTYKLALENATYDFDSSSGNFYIVASFIGYMYGIYGDIPMTFLGSAPYMDGGKEYWDAKVKSGEFTFRGINGENGSPMLKIPDLKLKLAQAANNMDYIKVSAEGALIESTYSNELLHTASLKDTYPFHNFYKPKQHYNEKSEVVDGNGGWLVKTYSSLTEVFTYLKKVMDFYSAIIAYDKEYKSNLSSYFKYNGLANLSKYGDTNGYPPEVVDYLYECRNDKKKFLTTLFKNVHLSIFLEFKPIPYSDANINGYKSYKDAFGWDNDNDKSDIEKTLDDAISEGNDFLNSYYETPNYPYGEEIRSWLKLQYDENKVFVLFFKENFFFKEGLYEKILELYEKIIEKNREHKRLYKEKQEAVIEAALGFRPSIKNIYDLMFAHMDTFIHTFYASTKIILNQLEGNKALRAKTTYQIGNGDTDTENADPTSENKRGNYLPPFAAYYQPSIGGVTNGKSLTWLENIYKGRDLEEVNFVKNLLTASETFFTKSKDIENLIAQISYSGSGQVVLDNSIINAEVFAVNEFTPITTSDFMFRDDFYNPYKGIKPLMDKRMEEIEANILTILGIRAAQYLHLVDTEYDENYDNTSVFGRVEAINLFKAVGDNFTNGFLDFLKKYIIHDSDDARSTFCERFPHWLTGTDTDTPLNSYINGNLPNVNKHLFAYNGNYLVYNYHKGITITRDDLLEKYGARKGDKYVMFPLYVESIKDLEKYYTLNEEEMLGNQNLISLYPQCKLYSADNSPVTTYKIIESKHYLKNIYNSFEWEIARALEYTEANAQPYGNRDKTQYNGLEGDDTSFGYYTDTINGDELHCFDDKFFNTPIINPNSSEVDEISNFSVFESTDEQTNNLIKYATFDYSFGDVPTSIFNNSLYWAQTDIRAKAYLFLNSATIVCGSNGISDASRNGLELKGILLREGSLYWAMDNSDAFVFPEEIELLNSKTEQKITLIPLKPEEGEIFFKEKDITSHYGSFDTLSKVGKHITLGKNGIFSVGKKIILGDNIIDDGYKKFKYPEGATASRRRVLKKYFEDWAINEESGYASAQNLLTDKELYSGTIIDDGLTYEVNKDLLFRTTKYCDFPLRYKIAFCEHLVANDNYTLTEDLGHHTTVKSYMFDDYVRNYDNGFDVSFLPKEERNSRRYTKLIQLQTFLKDIFFGICTEFDIYNSWNTNFMPILDDATNLKLLLPPKNDDEDKRQLLWTDKPIKGYHSFFSSVLLGFVKQLHLIYYRPIEDYKVSQEKFYENKASGEKSNPFRNTDIKLSTYMTLKNLYDKWLCAPYNGPEDTWTLKRINGSKSEFDNFRYVDNFYNDISNRLLANVTTASEWLSEITPTSTVYTSEGIMQYTGRTLYEYIAGIAQNCGGTLMAMPQKFSTTAEEVRDMFTPISINDDWDEDSGGYVFVYNYQPSQHLGDSTTSNVDMNGWSPNGDGLDFTDSEILANVLPDDNGYKIPAFGVTYAKQNQSVFKDIKLSTASMAVTEASISATMNIAAKSSESVRESTLYGQDLYRVYSNYSYSCSVTMMGNVQIMPLMYFQLNNIPFWRGAYMVIKVTHNIVAGNMTTTVEGIRQSRYAIPFADGAIISEPIDGSEVDDSTSSNGNSYINPIINDGDIPRLSTSYFRHVNNTDQALVVDTRGTSGGPNKNENHGLTLIKDTIGNSSAELGFVPQFTESNITDKKPIIYIHHAHRYGHEDKDRESRWSYKVVTKIVEILKTYNFSDGTNYSLNIHRGRAEGTKWFNNYTGTEAYKLVSKYGSKKVIAIVPHWNGRAGNYWAGIMNGPKQTTRLDSVELMQCICDEAIVVKDNRAILNIPDGMMDGRCSVRSYLCGNESNDSGTMPNCACALTENWFADYGNWQGVVWLESDEGINTIAEMHAKGIKRYIDSL